MYKLHLVYPCTWILSSLLGRTIITPPSTPTLCSTTPLKLASILSTLTFQFLYTFIFGWYIYMKCVLGWDMRQKLITLCPTSFELAGKKANFSAWVRRKLMEERKTVTIKKQMYGSYCIKCDITYQNSIAFMMENHYCKKCNTRCRFEGELEWLKLFTTTCIGKLLIWSKR